jgi:hypothetical protein
MGMEVKVTHNPGVQVQIAAARRRGLLKAGKEILAMSDARAPRLTGALIESGHVELIVEAEVDSVGIAYSDYKAVWQHEKTEYKHPHGEAKFLEKSLVESFESALEIVAATIREAE